MSNTVSSTESEKCKAAIEEADARLRDFLNETIASILLSAGSNPGDYDRDLFLPGPTNGYPRIRTEFLAEGASESWLRRYEQNKDNKAEGAARELVRARLAELPLPRRRSYYHDMICRHFDLAAALSFLQYTTAADFERRLTERLVRDLSKEDLVQRIIDSREVRNKKGHPTRDREEHLDAAAALEQLESLENLVRCFRPETAAPAVAEKRDEFRACAEKYLALFSNAPIPLAELERLPHFDMDDFESSRFINSYDSQTQTLYFTPLSEVESWLAAMAAKRQAGSRALAEAEARRRSAGAPLQKDLAYDPFAAAAAGAGALVAMRSYRGGPLSAEQRAELLENSIVTADADFWLDKDNRNFLRNRLMPQLFRLGGKLVVDWDTRVELFCAEANEGGKVPAHVQQLAKQAHNLISLAYDMGFVYYGGRDNQLLSSEGRILKTVREHPDRLFTVFTRRKDFCRRLLQHGIRNVIPVYLLPDGECSVRASAMPLAAAAVAAFGGASADANTAALPAVDTPKSAPAAPLPVPPVKPVETPAAPDKTPNVPPAMPDKTPNVPLPVPPTAPVKTPARRKPSAAAESVRCIVDTGERLTIGHLPTLGETVATSDGGHLTLTRELGNGGEGVVYAADTPGVVVKIYHENDLTVYRRNKLMEMIGHNPDIRELCWPIAAVMNAEGEFCGFTMPSAEGYTEFGRSVMILGDSVFAEQHMPQWTRRSLVLLCRELIRIFKLMHSKGILMGDVNKRNLMLCMESAKHPKVMFVDCDSFQFGGYPCPVGTPVFTSPRIYERLGNQPRYPEFLRTEEDENYAIASLLFHVLMLDQSPFSGKGVTDVMEAIRSYNFAYRLPNDPENTGADTPDGYARMIWNNIPKRTKEAFGRVFKYKEILSLDEWDSVLASYQGDIRSGYFTDELKPERYWDTPDKKFCVDFECYICHRTDLNMPKARFEADDKRHEPHLCNNCRSAAFRAREAEATAVCTRCGRKYKTDQWMLYLQSEGFRKPFCPQCREARKRQFSK